MINDDVLIKFARNRGFKYNWPDQVNLMKSRLEFVKSGFPGLGNKDLSLVEYKTINEGDLFILDICFEINQEDKTDAPIMFKVLPNKMAVIEGIGCGWDIKDPDRQKFRWKDVIPLPEIVDNYLVIRVDARPDLNGGPGYYYFFKSYRDNRY